MNLPLQTRAGVNVGIVPSYYPRVSDLKVKVQEIVLGDTILFEGPEEGVRFVGALNFTNTSLLALGGVNGGLLLVDALGNENGLETIALALPVAPVETESQLVSPTSLSLALAPGEKLIMRFPAVASPGYVGGAFVQGGYQDLYGTLSTRATLSTSLQTAVQPPPGKSLTSLLAGDAPGFLSNTDSVDHIVDIYINDGVTDLLVLKGITVAATTFEEVQIPALGDGQKIKMVVREAIATPGKTVAYLALWLLADEPSEV